MASGVELARQTRRSRLSNVNVAPAFARKCVDAPPCAHRSCGARHVGGVDGAAIPHTHENSRASDRLRGDRSELSGVFAPGLDARRRAMKSVVVAVSLALAVTVSARAERGVDPYAAAYAASMQDRLPLLVFVGQPARAVSGTRSIEVKTFPGAAAPSVVVGVV